MGGDESLSWVAGESVALFLRGKLEKQALVVIYSHFSSGLFSHNKTFLPYIRCALLTDDKYFCS